MNRSRTPSASSAAQNPGTLRVTLIRAGIIVTMLIAATAFALRANAQTMRSRLETRPTIGMAAMVTTAAPTSVLAPAASSRVVGGVNFAAVPYAVGEELTYRATFGGIPAGSARMRVDGIEMVRGRPAYHVVFSIDGGVPFFRVRDRYESWIDVQTLASLRYRQEISEGRYKRLRNYEIYPDRATYQEGDEPVQASVSHPLDDGSFIYAARVTRPEAGQTRRDDRYFRPDRNPVVLTGLRHDTVTVNAGTFATTVVRPSIKANGLFSENGDAQIWFSDDAGHYPVQVKTKFAKFALTLTLQSLTPGDATTRDRLLSAALAGQ